MAGYLVISRKINERIFIGDDIEILISDIQVDRKGRKRVKVAINAPRELKVNRCDMPARERIGDGPDTRDKS